MLIKSKILPCLCLDFFSDNAAYENIFVTIKYYSITKFSSSSSFNRKFVSTKALYTVNDSQDY